MIFVNAILTYFVWNDGYGWYAIIPIGISLLAGFFIGTGMMVSGKEAGEVKEIIKKKDPKLMAVIFFIDLIVAFALIIMLVAN